MEKVREILRLKQQCHLSERAISRALGVSRPVVKEYLSQLSKAGLNYSQVEQFTDDELLEVIKDSRQSRSVRYEVLSQKFNYFARELKRPGVTLERLWQEYRAEYPAGYGYSQFCYHFQLWRSASELTMHIEHKAGDKMFVDFTGKKLEIVDKDTGEVREVEVFVALLGASQYTYVEAIWSQKKADWIEANQNAFHYFGGTPRAVVPDCLKSAVTKPDNYEPDINPEYADFARHYQTAILPARPNRPRDKALAEGAVRIVYAWIFAAIRDRTFHTLHELNEAIREKLELYNARPMQRLKLSRKQLFEDLDKKVLQPLPPQRYSQRQFKRLKAQFNYHIYLKDDNHYYSVPYRYRGQRLLVVYDNTAIEIFQNNRRIAFHKRSKGPNRYTTVPEHMPSHHQAMSDWNPQRLIRWAASLGEYVEAVVTHILGERRHPEQAYRTCLGILALAKKYDNQRLNKACRRAIEFELYSYKGIKNILKNKIEDHQIDCFRQLPEHDNIRGNRYYQTKGEPNQ